ncbi:MAG: alpha/beta hydrolase, partial [Microbacterium sp.]|nr:alpha/beta hydrolase [Microbacterium sp.]
DYLRPAEAKERFSLIPHAVVVPVEGGRHLWVGETQTRRVLTEIVAAVNPDALPLPTEWDGPEAV